jgi:hypothetical protein
MSPKLVSLLLGHIEDEMIKNILYNIESANVPFCIKVIEDVFNTYKNILDNGINTHKTD